MEPNIDNLRQFLDEVRSIGFWWAGFSAVIIKTAVSFVRNLAIPYSPPVGLYFA